MLGKLRKKCDMCSVLIVLTLDQPQKLNITNEHLNRPSNARNQGRKPMPMCRLWTTHCSITIIMKIINNYIYLIIWMTLNFWNRWDV